MRRTIANFGRAGTALIVAGLLMGAGPAAAGRPATPKPLPLETMTWDTALAKLKAGKSLSFVEVTTSIDVSGSFKWPFECTACLFDKSFHAQDAVFTRVVDLRGTTFAGDVDMKGATFRGPVLFVPFQDIKFRTAGCASRHRRHPELKQPCLIVDDFQAAASFSLATFEDVADFEGLYFDGPVDFSLTRFRNEADFSLTIFNGEASFRNARFTGAASFLSATFNKLQFDYVRSSGSLDFSSATFTCTSCQGTKPAVRPDASFDYSVVDELAFDHATFDPGVRLSMRVLQATDLVLDPVDVRYVAENDPGERIQERILGLIETGAKSTNDLGVANEAHYRLQASRSARYPWLLHVLDFAFYRSLAGYLVEPFQPLLTLLALALTVSLLRELLPASRRRRLRLRVQVAWQQRSLRGARSRAKRLRPGSKPPGVIAGWWAGFFKYAHELLDTLTLMWPGGGASRAGRRLEANVYRILFVCMLIGFANSNPTLRQMFDALR